MPFLWRSKGKVEINVEQQANEPYTFRYIVQIPVRPKHLEYPCVFVVKSKYTCT
jgi:hypothetical protein